MAFVSTVFVSLAFVSSLQHLYQPSPAFASAVFEASFAVADICVIGTFVSAICVSTPIVLRTFVSIINSICSSRSVWSKLCRCWHSQGVDSSHRTLLTRCLIVCIENKQQQHLHWKLALLTRCRVVFIQKLQHFVSESFVLYWVKFSLKIIDSSHRTLLTRCLLVVFTGKLQTVCIRKVFSARTTHASPLSEQFLAFVFPILFGELSLKIIDSSHRTLFARCLLQVFIENKQQQLLHWK